MKNNIIAILSLLFAFGVCNVNAQYDIDRGNWKLGYYENDFGEKDETDPFYQIKLKGKDSNYNPITLCIRINMSEGFKIWIKNNQEGGIISLGESTRISLRNNITKETKALEIDERVDHTFCYIYNEDSMNYLLSSLKNGNFSIAIVIKNYLTGSKNYRVDVTNETLKIDLVVNDLVTLHNFYKSKK